MSEKQREQFREQKEELLADFKRHEEQGFSYPQMRDLFGMSALREIQEALKQIKIRDALSLYDKFVPHILAMLQPPTK